MDKVPAPTEPLPGRSCDGCTLCCKIMGVPEINKPRESWCSYCERGVGCRIYETRPEGCRNFLCGWLTNPRFGREWKPDRSKIVITAKRDGTILAGETVTETRQRPAVPRHVHLRAALVSFRRLRFEMRDQAGEVLAGRREAWFRG